MRARALPSTRLVRAALVAAWACAVWVGARVCVAASCPVELRGAPSEPWRRAGRAAIEALTKDPSDCARIEIELEPSTDAARLIFVTRDGRRAERRLSRPDELMPTVVALGVRGAREESTPALGDEPRVAPSSAVDAVSPLDSPASEPDAAPGEAGALFALFGGTRAGAGRLVSPVLGGAAAIAVDRWELGIHLALELQYFNLDLSETDVRTSAASVGVTVGRREPIADLELSFGGRTMVAALNDESRKDSGERGRAELRLGAYVGAVWPRTSSSRFRADVALDVVPHESLGSIGTPVTPWLAVSALMGVEFGGR